MCSSSSGSSPQNRYRGNPAPWQSNCLFCVQTQPQRGSRRSSRFSGGILVLFIALVVAPHMSLRLFPAFLLSASSSPSLVSWSHQLFRVRPAVPTHLLQYAVYCSCWPITHLTTINTATPNTLQLRTGLRPLLRHASQLSQTLIGCNLQGIDEVTFDEECQHNFTTSASAFRAPECCDHRCSQ